MSYYKKNAGSNRDALFGGKSSSAGSQPRVSAQRSSQTSQNKSTVTSTISSTTTATKNSNVVRKPRISNIRTISPEEKAKKMKEAEEFRTKAKKAMESGIFSRPDPVIASTYYRRAAELYKICDENRLERLHRIASADLQRGQNAFATAASEYTRAAELSECSSEKVGRKRNESYQLHKCASDAWIQMGDAGRAAESLLKSAFGLLIEVDVDEEMDSKALVRFEEAIEAHVPDPLNAFSAFRKHSSTQYSPDKNQAIHNLVTIPYAHETVFKAMYKLVEYQKYDTALYAAGASTTLLLNQKSATISLCRAFLNETVLQVCGIKDVVAADQCFTRVHLQHNVYLTSRECKLAEELIRAVKIMDCDALDEARDSNKGAIANLHPSLRNLLMQFEIMGGVRKPKPKPMPRTAAAVPNADEIRNQRMPDGEELQSSSDANFDEMENIMNDMGLNDDDEPDDDVDEFDLR